MDDCGRFIVITSMEFLKNDMSHLRAQSLKKQ